MRLAVPQDDADVDERVAGGDAPGGLGADALLDGGDERAGDGAADDPVGEFDAGAGGQRLDVDLADGVLAVAAGLFDVAAASGGGSGEGLPQGDAVRDGVDLDPVVVAQPVQGDLLVGLAQAPQDELSGVRVLFEAQGRVLGDEPGQAVGELVLVGLAVRPDGEREQGVGGGPGFEEQGVAGAGEGVAGLGGVEAGDAGEVSGDAGVEGALLLPERRGEGAARVRVPWQGRSSCAGPSRPWP